MESDRAGDMGFMEAMVAFMAVTVVLMAYLGAVATTTLPVSDPADSLDPGGFTGTIEAGTFVPGYTGYVEDLIASGLCQGVSVTVTVPGGYCEPVPPDVHGSMEGDLFSRTIAGTVTDDHGRVLPAVFEVVLCS